MSNCCLSIILVLVVVCVIILCAIYYLSRKIKQTGEAQAPATTTTHEDEEHPINYVSPQPPAFDTLTFTRSPTTGEPSVRLCQDEKCETTSICNLNICRHLKNVKVSYDKQTNKNVTYLHVDDKCIIVFITKNENLCLKEQDFQSEDINYIKSYTSKYIDMSVYKVQYDGQKKKFINFAGSEYDEYTIPLNTTNIIRELDNEDEYDNNEKILNIYPSAPALWGAESKGGIFYIEK